MTELPDNHPDKWHYSEHTRAKHEILNRYLGAWLSILGSRKANTTLLLVDGFAGRGVYTGGEPGSPQIMFQRATEIVDAGRAERVVIRAVEKHPDNFACLNTVCDSLSHPGVEIRAYHQTFSDYASNLAEQLHRRSNAPPTLVMVDPFGFSGVTLDVLQCLLAIPRVEVLLTFMARDMARFLELDNIEETLTSFFGGQSWRDCSHTNIANRPECLLLRYRQAVRPTVSAFATSFRVYEDERKAVLYYLVHLTNKALGMRRMKEAMVAQSSDMTFWPITVRSRDQLELDVAEADPFVSLQTHLLDAYSGRDVAFEELLNEDYPEGVWIEKQYRAALVALEKNDDPTKHVCIRRHRLTASGKPATRGIQVEDMITFPS